MNNKPEIIESTAVTVVESRSLIDYEPSLEDARILLERRKELFKIVLDVKEDIQEIKGKKFKKKSYWRKLASIYKVSLENVKEWHEEINGEIVYFFVFRATAPWGGVVEGTGSCSNKEKRETKSIHDTRATAETRAKNRAISDLLSFGEVSAEEINQMYGNGYKPKATYSQPPQDADFNPDDDIPDVVGIPPKTEKKSAQGNQVAATQINELLNKTYAKHINKDDFKDVTDQLKDGKWKEIPYMEICQLLRTVQNRCKDLKADQD